MDVQLSSDEYQKYYDSLRLIPLQMQRSRSRKLKINLMDNDTCSTPKQGKNTKT
jgi:hypothetical protein